MSFLLALVVLAALVTLGMAGPPAWFWPLAAGIVVGLLVTPWLAIPFALLAALLAMRGLRRATLSRAAMGLLKALGVVPTLSDTERTALEAGTVWVDGELFSGSPSWRRILDEPYPDLTAEESAFVDGPCERVCGMVDDWQTWVAQDLAPDVWAYLREQRFFGMVIPKAHGGLGFSARGHAAVVTKLASRSLPLAVTVMVPNSLGPAELLVHYGTREQKERYLPRLARGEEIPCFALTEPEAGSDAASLTARGVVFRGGDGRLMLRLDWSKRYITLGSVATLIGLAFVIEDPDGLLGKGVPLGITCALVPADTPGVVRGRRHDPLGVPFINCPLEGRGVEVPLEQVIGGLQGVGQGWRMLMETLAAGRGISLPSLSVGSAKVVARVTSAYTAVRRQFGIPLARFEGIEEPLARIGGLTYLMEAAQVFTCGAIDSGARPSVVSAMVKAAETELSRQVVRDGMDVLGGAGIVRGPRNLLAPLHVAQPIGITVEGANILTRTLIIFGQGAIRCHPAALREMDALSRGDLEGFDAALWDHARLGCRNGLRALVLSLSRGHLAGTPVDGPAARWVRKLAWASASYATLADLAMATQGARLKRRERICGRFADALTWMYLGTCVLRRFEAEGRRAEDVPYLDWASSHSLSQVQLAMDGILQELDVPVLGLLLRGPVAWWSRLNRFSAPPGDALGSAVARRLVAPSPQRDRVTGGIHLPSDPEQSLGRLERAHELTWRADAALERVREAVRLGRLPKADPWTLLEPAQQAGYLTRDEADLVRRAVAARKDVVQVDSFPVDQFAAAVPAPRGRVAAVAARGASLVLLALLALGARPVTAWADPPAAPPLVADTSAGEPVHAGRPLSYWLHLTRSDSADDADRGVEALVAIGPPAVGPLAEEARRSDLRDDVRKRAVRALEGIGRNHAEALPELVALATHEEGTVRRHAVSALGRMGDPGAMALAKGLSRRETVLPALRALRSLASAAAVAAPDVVTLLDDSDRDVRAKAVAALSRMGSGAVPSLRPALVSSSRRPAALAVVTAMGAPAKGAADEILAALADSRPEVRASAAGAVAAVTVEPSRAAPALAALLSDRETTVRVAAAAALDRMGADARPALKALTAALADRDASVRKAVIATLRDMADPSLVPVFAHAARDPSAGVRGSAGRALAGMGDAGLAALRAEAADSSADARADAVAGLGLVLREAGGADDALIETLSRAMRDKSPDVRAAASRGLGEAGRPAVPALTAALADDEAVVRLAALDALGAMGEAAIPAVPGIARLVQDRDRDVRLAACGVLQGLGPVAREAVPQLVVLLRDDVTRFRPWPAPRAGEGTRDVKLAAVAATVLGAIGPGAEAAAPDLVQALGDADPHVRQESADALRRVGVRRDDVLRALRAASHDDVSAVRRSADRALAELSGT